MLDVLAFICREHPRGFYYILFNLKEKEASTKELKPALQYTEPSKESPAIKQKNILCNHLVLLYLQNQESF